MYIRTGPDGPPLRRDMTATAFYQVKKHLKSVIKKYSPKFLRNKTKNLQSKSNNNTLIPI